MGPTLPPQRPFSSTKLTSTLFLAPKCKFLSLFPFKGLGFLFLDIYFILGYEVINVIIAAGKNTHLIF